jgi:hypothetical protein
MNKRLIKQRRKVLFRKAQLVKAADEAIKEVRATGVNHHALVLLDNLGVYHDFPASATSPGERFVYLCQEMRRLKSRAKKLGMKI